MTETWNPRDILNLDPLDSAFTCVGTTLKGYRCKNRVNMPDRLHASKMLDGLATQNPRATRATLSKLAELTLCVRYHRQPGYSQVESIRRTWWNSINSSFPEVVVTPSLVTIAPLGTSRETATMELSSSSDDISQLLGTHAALRVVFSATSDALPPPPEPTIQRNRQALPPLQVRAIPASASPRVPAALPTPQPSPVPSQVRRRSPSPVASPTPQPSPVPSQVRVRSPSPATLTTRHPSPVPSQVRVRSPSPATLTTRHPSPVPSQVRVRSPSPAALTTRHPSPGPSQVRVRSPSPVTSLPPTSLVAQPSEPRTPSNSSQRPTNTWLQLTPEPPTPSSPACPSHTRRKPLTDPCPVCTEPICCADDAVWCRAQCGHNIHRACFAPWARLIWARRDHDDRRVTCVYCRADWKFDWED